MGLFSFARTIYLSDDLLRVWDGNYPRSYPRQ